MSGKMMIGLAIALLLAGDGYAADAKKGAQVFAQCQVCHTAQRGAGNNVGPNLFGVVGRRAGSVVGFAYSDALKRSGFVWSNDKLNTWISGPAEMVPGTKMIFPGIADPAKRADVVAYLDTLK